MSRSWLMKLRRVLPVPWACAGPESGPKQRVKTPPARRGAGQQEQSGTVR